MAPTGYVHYSSNQFILLVGDGDFTFASALASVLGDSRKLYATSLNSEAYTFKKYSKAPKALWNLRRRGAQIFYNFDATTSSFNSPRFFHRIIFNFPHAGYFGMPEWVKCVIRRHQDLIQRFLLNASKMIHPNGEIHVTIQDYDPYNRWNIGDIAFKCGLRLKDSVYFDMAAYPGYCNRRGSGRRAGQTFPIGRGLLKTYKIGF